jgi:hypothetical protein
MAPKSSKPKYIDEVKRLYITELWSLSEISQRLGPSVQTLSRWLGEEGIELAARPRDPNAGRTPGAQAEINQRISAAQAARLESGGNRGGRVKQFAEETRSCANPGCDAAFRVREDSSQQFCSRQCARTVGNKQRWDGKKNMTTCPCGEIFYSPYPKKYHSDECRQEYGGKRQPNPANTLTGICQNPGCPQSAREFSYPKSQGHRKYCSDKCSQEHVRPIEQLNGLEKQFTGLCELTGIGWRRPFADEQISWGERGSYAPDFICEWQGSVVAIETKGDYWIKEDTHAKIDAWRVRKEIPVILLFESQVRELRMIPDAAAFWMRLQG